MTGISFWNERLGGDLQASLLKPTTIGTGVSVAPPHRGVAAEPVVFRASPGTVTGDGQQPARRAQPAGGPPQQARLGAQRHVDEGIQADDGVEGQASQADSPARCGVIRLVRARRSEFGWKQGR
jgi:hypothetical protein